MKKLQRDTQNRVLGGVCSGLANYFDIDVALVRVLFAFALMPEAPLGETQQFVETQDVVEKSRKSSMTTGLILIGVGACFLLGNLVPAFSWRMFWPILLIALGLLLIVPQKDKNS